MNREILIVKKSDEKYRLHIHDIDDKYTQNLDVTVIYLIRKYKFTDPYILELTIKYHITFAKYVDKKILQGIDIKDAYLHFYSRWEAQKFIDEVLVPLDMVNKLINA